MIKDLEKRLQVIEDFLKINTKKSGNITDRVTDFKSACEELNIKTHGDAYDILELDRKLLRLTPIEDCEDIVLKLMICVYALNEGETPDITDPTIKKYFPYFDISENGFRFLISGFRHWHVNSPSQLALKTSELAKFAGETFLPLYKEYITCKK